MHRHNARVPSALLVALALAFAVLLAPARAQAQRAGAPRAQSRAVTLPFDVGIGPAAYLVTGPIHQDQTFHWGLRISTFAVIDRATRRRYRSRIPPQYRRLSDRAGEVRYNPLSWFVPSSLFISPAYRNTGMYGLTMRPIGLGLAMADASTRFSLGAGLLMTYAFIHSDSLPSPTHFLRPGVDLNAELEFTITSDFLLALGWASQFYPPQEVGGSILRLGKLDRSIWHIGQAYLQFHVRFPVTTTF